MEGRASRQDFPEISTGVGTLRGGDLFGCAGDNDPSTRITGLGSDVENPVR